MPVHQDVYVFTCDPLRGVAIRLPNGSYLDVPEAFLDIIRIVEEREMKSKVSSSLVFEFDQAAFITRYNGEWRFLWGAESLHHTDRKWLEAQISRKFGWLECVFSGEEVAIYLPKVDS